MSYNGSGTFVINTTGQPVVDGTVISASVFNSLTADLGTGLTTAITKDGQTTPTANIPMGTYKITGLGAGTAATDAVRMSQLQAGGTTFLTAAGTDTITATASPALTAYATGNLFSFVVANTNTSAVTLNVDGLGAKAITRDGTTALAANDLIATEGVLVLYDGTRFQVINPNAATNFRVSGTLGVTGVATMTAAPVFSSATASLPMFTDGSKALVSNAMTGTGSVVMSASPTMTGTIAAANETLSGTLGVTGVATFTAAPVFSSATASLPMFTNGSKALVSNAMTGTGNVVMSASPTLTGTIGAASQTLSGTLGVTGATTLSSTLGVTGVSTFAAGSAAAPALTTTGDTNTGIFFPAADTIAFAEGGAEAMRIDSSGNVIMAATNSGTFSTGTAGTSNLRLGVNAGNSIVSGGNYNTLVGDEAGTAITTGTGNTAVGYTALYSNTTGINNTAVGYAALTSNTTGASNTAVGLNALYSNTTATSNIAVGTSALYSSTTGGDNTAVGTNALYSNTTGTGNVAVGVSVLFSSTGSNNTAVGNGAGYTASTNIVANTTGSNNTFLGNGAGNLLAATSNGICLGNSSVTALRCQITTIAGISDARDKKDIQDIPIGLEFINALRPVSFKWNMRGAAETGVGKIDIPEFGFIAQDLQQAQVRTNTVVPNLVYDENPERLEAAPGALIPILVRAIQELKAEFDAYKTAHA